jgi:hypothetical protein
MKSMVTVIEPSPERHWAAAARHDGAAERHADAATVQ